MVGMLAHRPFAGPTGPGAVATAIRDSVGARRSCRSIPISALQVSRTTGATDWRRRQDAHLVAEDGYVFPIVEQARRIGTVGQASGVFRGYVRPCRCAWLRMRGRHVPAPIYRSCKASEAADQSEKRPRQIAASTVMRPVRRAGLGLAGFRCARARCRAAASPAAFFLARCAPVRDCIEGFLRHRTTLTRR